MTNSIKHNKRETKKRYNTTQNQQTKKPKFQQRLELSITERKTHLEYEEIKQLNRS